MKVALSAALFFLAIVPNLSVRLKKRKPFSLLEDSVESRPPHEENVQRCKEICEDPERAARHRARILGTVDNYKTLEAPAYIYTFGGTATGKTTLQKHVEKAASNVKFIDTSKDGLMWQWDPEWLALMGAKGLTRQQRFDIRDVTRGCRMGADAVERPLNEMAMKAQKNIYQECTRTDAAKSPPPLNEIYEEDAGLLNASRTKWSSYAIYYAFNVVFDMESRIEAEAERAEKNGFIVPEATLRGQLPLDFQWIYMKNAVALIKTGLGRSRKFFVQRKCVVKEEPNVVDITTNVEELARQTDSNPKEFRWTPSQINEMLDKWAPLRTDCLAKSAVN